MARAEPVPDDPTPTGDRSVRRHVALVGPMGVGKSTVATLLARRLGRAYVDNDVVLAERFGATAHELADRLGIDGLHDLEAQVVEQELRWPEPAVITAASSIVDDPASRARVRAGAIVVGLDADADELAARVPEKGNRPTLHLDATAIAARLDEYRAMSDIVVRTSGQDPEQTVATIIEQLRARGIDPDAPAPSGA